MNPCIVNTTPSDSLLYLTLLTNLLTMTQDFKEKQQFNVFLYLLKRKIEHT